MTESQDSHTPCGPTRGRSRVRVLYTIFFLSGVAGLGYQMAWSRMFAIGLGHEMPSVLAVVAAFFGGLALGSWALDGRVSRSPRPGYWYVGLELLIGVWGFVSLGLVGWANELAFNLIGIEPAPVWHWTVAFVVPLIVLLPATTAMGATLPAMERFVSPWVSDGRCVGGLYAVNTAGAVVGTLASAFIIMPLTGFRGTVALLAAVNLLCAVAVIAMGPKREVLGGVRSPQLTDSIPLWRIGVTVFFTGLLGIGYEVLGVRVMSQVLENTIYSFAAVLSVYLLGTAGGAALYQRLGRNAPFAPLLGYLLCGLSTACILGTLLMSTARSVYARARSDFFGDSLYGVMASEMFVAITVFALPTMLMGAAFSHLVQAARRKDGGVGRAAAINTLGGAIAPLVFGVVLLPILGAKWVLVVVSLAYLLLIPKKSGVHWVLEVVPIVLVLALPPNLQVLTMLSQEKLIEYREGVMAAVAVTRDVAGDLSLRVNNRFQMGNTKGAVFECIQAQTPLLLHPDPKRALFLGLGSAITFRSAAFHPGLIADGVELIPEVVEAAIHFTPANLPSGSNRNLKIHAADARRFVRATNNRYDVIIADLFHPGRDGAGSLYTREHYQSISKRLAPGGLFCQWLPLYQLDDATLRVIIRTFLEVFPNTRAYLVDFEIAHPALGLIATEKVAHYTSDWFGRRVRTEQLRRYLKGLLINSGVRLMGSCIADSDQLSRYAAGAAVATDDFPVVSFMAPRFTSRQDATSYGRLQGLLEHCRLNPAEIIDPQGSPEAKEFIERLSRYIESRDIFLHGLFKGAQGNSQEAFTAFLHSVRTSKEFTPAYAYCLGMARNEAKRDSQKAQLLLEQLIEVRPDRPDARNTLRRLQGQRDVE